MDMDFFTLLFKMIVALVITLGLMFLTFKVMGTKVNNINDGKYVKIIERVQVGKESSILVIKVGKKGYVLTNTSEHMEKLSELTEDEVTYIEENNRKKAQDMSESYSRFVLKSKEGIFKILNNIKSKEDKHED